MSSMIVEVLKYITLCTLTLAILSILSQGAKEQEIRMVEESRRQATIEQSIDLVKSCYELYLENDDYYIHHIFGPTKEELLHCLETRRILGR